MIGTLSQMIFVSCNGHATLSAVSIVHPYMCLLIVQHICKVAENAMLPFQCCLAVMRVLAYIAV